MPTHHNISIAVIRRLPRYYRFLGELMNVGLQRISSASLSEEMGLTASQIRQDLNCFGGFGQQGYGYNIKELHDQIGVILGLDQPTKAIIIGAGNLGRAVINHMDFGNRGFVLEGIFDQDKKLINQEIKGIKVLDTSEIQSFCNVHKPTVAVLCIPKTATEKISNLLIECGVRGFWNFSHYDINSDVEGVVVENVHMSDSLMTLSYRIKEANLDK